MVTTPSGRRLLRALWRVEEEQKYLNEPAPIPRHPTVENTAVTWDQLKRQSRAMKNAVSENAFYMIFFYSLSERLNIRIMQHHA